MTGSGNLLVVDGIETGIRAHQIEHLGVVVTDSADVELLCPAGFAVHDGLIVQEGAAELVQFFLAGTLAQENQFEDGFNLQLRVILGIEVLQAVVGEFAAVGGKEVVTLLEGFTKVGIGFNLHIGGRT